VANVLDTFNRADNPTSLGVATSGQTWTQVAAQGAGGLTGNPYGIDSNAGFNAGTGGAAAGDSLVVVDSGMSVTRGQVTIMNADAGSLENLRNQGVIILYVDDTHYVFLTYARAGGGLFRLYIADGGTATHRGPDCSVVMADGDTMGWTICGQTIDALHNGVSAQNYPITFTSGGGFVMSDTLLAGTKQGLQAAPGTSAPGTLPIFEDFMVEANDECLTYDCSEAGCVLNPDGLGEFSSLAACEVSCGIAPSYNCLDGVCCDPGDGSGAFATLAECQAAGCGSSDSGGSGTMRFNAGEGSRYYVVPPISDSGNETRSKVMKSGRVTGKVTNAKVKFYPWDVDDEISVTDLEEGTTFATDVNLTDTTQVAQSQRQQVNVPNAVLSTVRVEGDDRGEATRDRVDEIVIEQAQQGVRR